jgi:hypothetical protein
VAVGGGLAGIAALIAAGVIVVKITNPDGTTTEVKVPDGAQVAVEKDGKRVFETKPAEAKKPAPPPTDPANDPDRHAAEWLLARRGAVLLEGGTVVSDPKGLPAGRFRVEAVYGQDHPFGDDDVDHLRGLARVDTVRLARAALTDKGLEKLAGLPWAEGLRVLDLDWRRTAPPGGDDGLVTDAGLAHVGKLKSLEELSLARTRVTGSGFDPLARLPRLKHVALSESPVTDESLAKLVTLKLEHVGLSVTPVTDAGVKTLSTIPTLTYLALHSQPGVTDDGVGHMVGHTNFNRLAIHGTKVTPEAIGRLTNLTSLTTGTDIGDDDLRQFRGLTKLGSLTLQGSKVSGPGVDHLAGLPALAHVSVTASPLTDDGLGRLAKLKPLRHLHLVDTQVTAAGVAKFRAARPDCFVEGNFPEK